MEARDTSSQNLASITTDTLRSCCEGSYSAYRPDTTNIVTQRTTKNQAV